ncbi:MAG: PAS domain-containing protein [Verrucomicrobiae bacterium]|nr:PAS domain-containing protein [Verrucomicrobiae bacterium]
MKINPEAADAKLQQKLTQAFNQSPTAMFVTGAGGNIEFANEAFCRSRGCSPEEICDRHCQDFGIQHLTGEEVSAMWRELGAAHPWKTETSYAQPDGRVRWEEIRLQGLIDESGQLTGLVGSLTDITQRKQNDLALRESEEKLRRILQAAHDAIILVDEEGKIRLWNQAASRIYGYSNEEAMGKDILELLAPARDLEKVRATFRESLVSGQGSGINQTTEWTMRRKDGQEIMVELSLTAVMFGDQRFFLGVDRDITERKKSEMERELLIKSLEEALANVKTLSGLVPICAACKRIRDDKGYWNQVEAYISSHSEARFSHGICPECIHKLYPEIESEL